VNSSKSGQKSGSVRKRQGNPLASLDGSIEEQIRTIVIQASKQTKDYEDLISELIKKNENQANLSTRDACLLAVFAKKKMQTSEWKSIFAQLSTKPKLRQEVLNLVIEKAISAGQNLEVLHFVLIGKSADRNLVTSMRNKQNFSDDALTCLKQLQNIGFDYWKEYSSQVKWLGNLITDDQVEDHLKVVINILQRLEKTGLPPRVTKLHLKKTVAQCFEVLLSEQIRSKFLTLLGRDKFDINMALSFMNLIKRVGLDEEVQVGVIRAFADADNLSIIREKRVWSQVEISVIAASASHKKILDALSESREIFESQFSSAIRSRSKGLGLIIQLCDQFPDFANLIDLTAIKKINIESRPSSVIFTALSEKTTQDEVDRSKLQIANLNIKHDEIENRLKKSIDTKISEIEALNSKISGLESKISEKNSEKSIAQETVLWQARVEALTAAIEIIDEVRILAEEMKQVDQTTVGNLYRSSLRKMKKFDVMVILPNEGDRSNDPNLFEVNNLGNVDSGFAGRPAYIVKSGGLEFVLRRGLRSKR